MATQQLLISMDIIADVEAILRIPPEQIVGWIQSNTPKMQAIYAYVRRNPLVSVDVMAAAAAGTATAGGGDATLAGITADDITRATQIGNAIALSMLRASIVPCVIITVSI